MDVLDLEGIDDDLELELEVGGMDTGKLPSSLPQGRAEVLDLDRPMSRLSVMPDAVGPSMNELRLGKRVAELEKEREILAVSHLYSFADRCSADRRPS
jgi:hypothetical protein